MAAGLTNHVWTLREVLRFRVPPWSQPQSLEVADERDDRGAEPETCACGHEQRASQGPVLPIGRTMMALVHAMLAATDRSISFIRRLKVHDRMPGPWSTASIRTNAYPSQLYHTYLFTSKYIKKILN
jgi:hypothetical protein